MLSCAKLCKTHAEDTNNDHTLQRLLVQSLSETGGSWSDCKQVSSTHSLFGWFWQSTVTEEGQVFQHGNAGKLCAEIVEGIKVSWVISLRIMLRGLHTSRVFWYEKWNTTCNQQLPRLQRRSFQLEKGWTQCHEKQIWGKVRDRASKHPERALFCLCWS